MQKSLQRSRKKWYEWLTIIQMVLEWILKGVKAAGFRPEPLLLKDKESRKGVPGVPNFGRMKINP
jgi:hypothetical protein